MSKKVKTDEALPLLEKPQPVPGRQSKFQPPPNSGIHGSGSQSYTPVSPSPTAPPHPMLQMPMPQDTTSYNRTGQATMDIGRLISRAGLDSAYVRTIYDPMENRPPVNQGSTPDQTMAVSSQPANFSGRTRRTFPLMDNPQPQPGEVPDFYPPPCSSLIGSQFQGYTTYPPPPNTPPRPMQMPMPQHTINYNPTSPVTRINRKLVSSPMPDEQRIPIQTEADFSESGDSSKTAQLSPESMVCCVAFIVVLIVISSFCYLYISHP